MYTTYREPLCELDTRGVPFFSPLCDPNLDKSKLYEDMSDKRSFSQMKPLEAGCKITPLEPRRAQVAQFDDSSSAHDWFKDPTYAQRMNARKRGINEAVLESNPSLQEYHRIKTMEKVASSVMQSL